MNLLQSMKETQPQQQSKTFAAAGAVTATTKTITKVCVVGGTMTHLKWYLIARGRDMKPSLQSTIIYHTLTLPPDAGLNDAIRCHEQAKTMADSIDPFSNVDASIWEKQTSKPKQLPVFPLTQAPTPIWPNTRSVTMSFASGIDRSNII
jgi:hypothetical protein